MPDVRPQDPELLARRHEADAALVARIRQGIADDEFVVHYQPIVDIGGGQVLTLEALVRWEHPDRGILLPDQFLAAAEASGTIIDLGELVLDKACRQAAAWRDDGADVRLSVNVSTRQLVHPGLVDRVTGVLRSTGFDPAYLWLEITETAVVEELEQASQVLRALAEMGVCVSIDDFGTGWASLTYLQNFPVHAMKIDGSFVAGAGHDLTSMAIIRSILALGDELGVFVVAEGVETAEQHDVMEAAGCTLGQGYYYGRPMPADEVPIERAGRRTQPNSAAATHDLHALSPFERRLASAAVDRPSPENATQIESNAVATLLRGLLRVTSAPGAVELLHRTIEKMGGTIVPAAEASDDAFPVNVSLGEGPVLLVEAQRFTVARMRLERVLPQLVEDARQAIDLHRRTERLQDETIRDGLTGLANRRVLDRVLPRATSGTIVMLDLDAFKQVNDEHGHAAGDDLLRAFGEALGAEVRAQDTACRLGGDEFALVLADLDVDAATNVVDRIRRSWRASRQPSTFSAGVAPVTDDGGTAALLAADGALYRAKRLGRDRTEGALVACGSVTQR